MTRLATFQLVSIFLLGIASGIFEAAYAASTGPRIRVANVDASRYPRVSVQVHVSYPGGIPPSALTASGFTVSDGGQSAVAVQSRLQRETQVHTNVLMLIDVGPSQLGAQINVSQAASTSFLSGLGPEDRVAISTFASQVHQLAGFTTNRAELNSVLGNLSVDQHSSRIFDALCSSLQGLAPGSKERYAIILMTDGKDVHSRHTQAQCITLARQKGIAIYSVALGTTPVTGVLKVTASESNGQFFEARNTDQLRSIYRRLVLVFRHDYVLTYTASDVHHRGDRVSVQVRYTSSGSSPLLASARYTVPFAPWVDVKQSPSDLGTLDDPSHTAVSMVLASESTHSQRISLSAAGWPRLTITPSTITVPPYGAGDLHQTFVLHSPAIFPHGGQGRLTLTLHPSTAGTLIDHPKLSVLYTLLPRRITISPGTVDLGHVADFRHAQAVHLMIRSALPAATLLRVAIHGLAGGSVTPTQVTVPGKTGSKGYRAVVQVQAQTLPEQGQPGHFSLSFSPAGRGVLLVPRNLIVDYIAFARLVRIDGLPANLNGAADLRSGHTLHIRFHSTVREPTGMRVNVSGPAGTSIHPSVVPLSSALTQTDTPVDLTLRVPSAREGRHGQVTLHFRSVTPGTRVEHDTAVMPYYVPTWFERNWWWLLLSAVVIALAIWIGSAFGWENLTTRFDNWRRGYAERRSA